MRVTVLGCGTSGGVPRIGGHWGVCDPDEPRNRRRRSSIAVEACGSRVLIDTTPDLREQCLDAEIDRVDAVLYTHEHADHVNGIDDLRAFMILQGERVPAYGNALTMELLSQRFDYIFQGSGGYPPICAGHVIDGPFRVGGMPVTPFSQRHGGMETLGFRIGDFAYSTDLNGLPDASKELLRDLDVWIVDALKPTPHPTHAHLPQTLAWIEELRPRQAYLTHMTWDMDYRTLLDELPEGVAPAYDGLVIDLPDPPA